MKSVQTLMQAGAGAVKLERVDGNLHHIKHIVESGVPVMGHIGLVPQSIWSLGGFKVQGRKAEQQHILMEEAKALEDAGCFAIVLECVPHVLAKNISKALRIPTIGIGAGPHTDGQILVFQDAMGLQSAFQPKFLKQYCQGEALFIESLNRFVKEVQTVDYPSLEHAYESH
jgi:3-methyl-2-oxobutanoate hydroxymethyltransferase